MSVTDDRTDPRLTHGVNEEPVPMAEVYLVLSEAERKKGWVRPFRDRYTHVGYFGPKYPLRDLTAEEQEHNNQSYVKYEEYPEGSGILGRYWTQKRLDNARKGCSVSTWMGQALAETYAREPTFYGATYCVGCKMHRPVEEFTWDADGTVVGS